MNNTIAVMLVMMMRLNFAPPRPSRGGKKDRERGFRAPWPPLLEMTDLYGTL